MTWAAWPRPPPTSTTKGVSAVVGVVIALRQGNSVIDAVPCVDAVVMAMLKLAMRAGKCAIHSKMGTPPVWKWKV